MSKAALQPSFEETGAPLSVLVDFDGTISWHDVGDALLARFVADQDEVRHMDQLYLDHVKGSRELIVWDMEVLPREPTVLMEAVDAIPLDETVADLVRVVRNAGGAVEIVSDGVGFHVERMLAGLGLSDLPIATNATALGAGGDGVTFPYGHPACLVCGTCKRERVRLHQEAGRAVVFVGDGPSDRYAAHHADINFAKAALASWCDAAGIPYEPWLRLADVADWIEKALTDGRLPVDQQVFGVWAARARPALETFICGPEVWGEGRTTAPPGAFVHHSLR